MTPTIAEPVEMRRRRSQLIAAATALFVIDLVTKVTASMALAEEPIDLPGPLDLRLAHNRGVAFGLGSRAPTWLVFVATTTIAVGIAVAAWRGRFPSPIAAGLLVGGALANVADRLEAGTVVDMFYLGWWPTFNVADVGVTVGGALLVLSAFRAARQDDHDLVEAGS